MGSREIGKLGEDLAVKYLRCRGFRILDRNFEARIGGTKLGEIDIVAKKGNSIIFIEVKTLANGKSSFLPEDKINQQKKKSLIKSAEFWLARNKMPLDYRWQIDIISVRVDTQKRKAKIFRFPDAISL